MKEEVIETSRLLIREFEAGDINALYDLYEESDTRFLQPLSEDREEELEKLKSYIHYIYGFYGFGLWAVCLKDSGRIIGRCGIQVLFLEEWEEGEYELGYMISGEYTGQGYGREAVEGILGYAREELEASRIILRIDKKNEDSIRFSEKLGFRKWEKDLYFYEL